MDGRRKTLTSYDPKGQAGGSSIPVPASALRNGLQQSHNAGAYGGGAGPSRSAGGRHSMAPQRAGGRASLASFAHHLPPPQQPDFTGSQGGFSSQGSQPLGSSQQDFASTAQRRQSTLPHQAPYTAVRPNNALFSSAAAQRMAMSAGRSDAGYLRSTFGQPGAATPGTASRGNASMSRRKSGPGVSLLPVLRSMKDPRVRDKTALAELHNELFGFLNTHRYPGSIPRRTLEPPTTKDFQNIFRFLYGFIDPEYKFGVQGKKFEDEVIILLKAMGYPCVEHISKSGLQAPGGMHTWPTMLTMLHWMYTKMDASLQAFESYPPLRVDPEAEVRPGDEDAECRAGIAYWLGFLGDTYASFLVSDDYDSEGPKSLLEKRFQQRMERHRIAVECHEKDKVQLNTELKRLLEMTDPLEEAEAQLAKRARDVKNTLGYVEKYQQHVRHVEKRNEGDAKRIKEAEEELEETQRRRDALDAQIDSQTMTSAKFQRIAADHKKLEADYHIAEGKRQRLLETVEGLEIRVQNFSDEIEKLLEGYKSEAFALELIPQAPPPCEHVDFGQAVNGGVGASGLADMVPDVQAEIKPALLQLKGLTMKKRREVSDQVLRAEEKLLTLTEALERKKEALDDAQGQVEQLAQAANNAKEAQTAEATRLAQQAENLQRQNQDIRYSMAGGLQAIEQRLEALCSEHDQLVEQVDRVRRENVDEFEQMLEVLVDYKTRCTEKVALLKWSAEKA